MEIFIYMLNLKESITQASNLIHPFHYKDLITLISPKCQNIYFFFNIIFLKGWLIYLIIGSIYVRESKDREK